MRKEIGTGCEPLDTILKGGFTAGTLNLIYGEATAGKTTLVLYIAFKNLERNQNINIYYIDSDNKLSTERIIQIAKSEEDLQRLNIQTPNSFDEQASIIETLPKYLEKDDLLIIDSITGLYRLETGDAEKTFQLNKELNRQLAYLKEISLTGGITVIITGQVRSVFDAGNDIEPVAPRLLHFWSDTILKLEGTPHMGIRQAILEKPRGNGTCYIKITKKGIEEVIQV